MANRSAQAVPPHERMRVGLLLTFVGGFLEAYTYVLHGHVFANAQTGNMALFAVHLMQKTGQAWYYLVPIGAFLCGIMASEWLRRVLGRRRWARWEQLIVLIEALLLAVIAFLPAATPDAVVNVAVAFICSLQFDTFRKTHGLAYATTFCTGNLRSAGENLYCALADRDRGRAVASARYFGVIAAFILGVAVGVWVVGLLGAYAALVCTALCLAAWALMCWG